MSNKKFTSANGKGYYIALALCALAIGVSGYLYYANANDEQPKRRTQTLLWPSQFPLRSRMCP